MPYTYRLTSVIPATPQEIYDAWLDSETHSEMTGADATMSDEVGAEVSAWNGDITGRNLELVPGERIVQSWRTSKFDDEHEDSIVTLTLEGTDEGTLLTLVHSNVPEDQKGYEEGGWESNYFEPMRLYFAGLEEDGADEEEAAEEEAEPAAPKPASKPATKPASKPRRAAGRTAKKAAAKAKPAKVRKTKRAAPAKAKARKAKASAKKTTKRAAPKRTAAVRKRTKRTRR